MNKKIFLGAAITAGVGLVTAVVLTVISGLEYRRAEDQGVNLVRAPLWIAVGTNVGLLILALALVAMAGMGVLALLQRMVDHRSN